MTLPFRKKVKDQKISRPKFKTGSYSHLREKQKAKLPNIKVGLPRVLPKNYRFRYSSLIIIASGIIVAGIIYTIFFSDVFKIKTITFLSSDPEIEEIISRSYLNRSIVLTSISNLEKDISDNSQYIEQIYIRKIYPNTIEINIDSVTPAYFYLDFHQYALFDENNKIIELEAIPSALDLIAIEKQWLAGELDTDSHYVQEKYFESLPEDQISDFDWGTVSIEAKSQIVQTVANDVNTKIQNYFETQSQFLVRNVGEYRVIKFFGYRDADELIQGSSIIDTSLALQNSLREYYDAEDLNLEWKNEIRLEVYTPDQKILIFGEIPGRSISDQIERFILVYNSTLYQQNRIFDFRTENFVGKN